MANKRFLDALKSGSAPVVDYNDIDTIDPVEQQFNKIESEPSNEGFEEDFNNTEINTNIDLDLDLETFNNSSSNNNVSLESSLNSDSANIDFELSEEDMMLSASTENIPDPLEQYRISEDELANLTYEDIPLLEDYCEKLDEIGSVESKELSSLYSEFIGRLKDEHEKAKQKEAEDILIKGIRQNIADNVLDSEIINFMSTKEDISKLDDLLSNLSDISDRVENSSLSVINQKRLIDEISHLRKIYIEKKEVIEKLLEEIPKRRGRKSLAQLEEEASAKEEETENTNEDTLNESFSTRFDVQTLVFNHICKKIMEDLKENYSSNIYTKEFACKLFDALIKDIDKLNDEANDGESSILDCRTVNNPLFIALVDEILESDFENDYLGKDLTRLTLNYIKSNSNNE